VPFEKWGGLKFLEAAHVKDVLAFLRVLENPRDEVSWYRLLQLLPGVGDATARGAIALLAEHAWDPDAFARFRPPPRAREGHTRLAAVLRDLRADRDGRAPGAEIARFRTLYDAGAPRALRPRRAAARRPRPAPDDRERLPEPRRLPHRARARAALGHAGPRRPADGDRDALVLSTVHSAKGKEWDAVFVIWAVDGFFPSSRSLGDEDELDEERRLMYVAMTRRATTSRWCTRSTSTARGAAPTTRSTSSRASSTATCGADAARGARGRPAGGAAAGPGGPVGGGPARGAARPFGG
jgi:DNA helicase-2/ATP-dependent DNA helicase PcrA